MQRTRPHRSQQRSSDSPFREAWRETGNLRTYLDADATLIDLGDKDGATPLHHATQCGRRDAIVLLLDRGANIHAALGGFLGTELQPIDLAIWGNNPLAPRTGDLKTTRRLLERGAAYDLTIACAFGDLERVRECLDLDPSLIRAIRACGRRPLSSATEFGHNLVVRLLLDRGANPIGWASVELRPMMIAHGGKLDPTDDEILKRVKEDLPSAQREFG